MTAATYSMTFDQGSTWSLVITYRDSNGALVDMTGRTARMQVRASASAASPLIELTTENGRLTLGGVAGTITLDVDATTTAAVAAGQYVYDLEIVTGTVVTKLLTGDFEVRAEVTR